MCLAALLAALDLPRWTCISLARHVVNFSKVDLLVKRQFSCWQVNDSHSSLILQEGLASMAVVQRKWAYLEPIFARGALPSHASQFRQVSITLS